MGLIDRFLPERLPRQVVFAGDRQAETFRLRDGRVAGRTLGPGTALAENADDGWADLVAALPAEETGVIFNAAPFIYNFFEFDKLPWQPRALRELVSWRLQKIFPEDIAAYDHRLFPLDRKRVFSILVRRSLLERVEADFAQKPVPLTYIGNSTMEIMDRARRAKVPPDFIIESDGASCTMVFQSRRSPIYIRKFRSDSPADATEEIGKTVAFVRSQYGIEPRRYWLHDHQGGADATEAALAGGDYSRLRAGLGETPHIPGTP
jgi:hypothetical protein